MRGTRLVNKQCLAFCSPGRGRKKKWACCTGSNCAARDPCTGFWWLTAGPNTASLQPVPQTIWSVTRFSPNGRGRICDSEMLTLALPPLRLAFCWSHPRNPFVKWCAVRRNWASLRVPPCGQAPPSHSYHRGGGGGVGSSDEAMRGSATGWVTYNCVLLLSCVPGSGASGS